MRALTHTIPKPRPVVALILALGLGTAVAVPCQAQVFPGSTVQGDILRGAGVYFEGLGFYNLNTAQARSINTDTDMRINEYWLILFRNRNREIAQRNLAELELLKRMRDERGRTLLETPHAADVASGAALNALMDLMVDPKFQRSAWSTARVNLEAEIAQSIPYLMPSQGMKLALPLLKTVEGWPVLLRDETFKVERRNYLSAMNTVLQQSQDGKLTTDAVEAVDRALGDLERAFRDHGSRADLTRFTMAQNFLIELRKSTAVLRLPFVDGLLGELERYPGTTMADLMDFMHRHKLRFHQASTPSERGLYRQLYELLARQREMLVSRAMLPDMGAPLVPEEVARPAPASAPARNVPSPPVPGVEP